MYVSRFDRKSQQYWVTDTDDGSTQPCTHAELMHFVKNLGMKIDGVSGSQVSVVSLTSQVMGVGFAGIEKQVEALVSGYSEETCMEIARKGSFVKKIKGLPLSEMHRVTMQHIYPDSIKSAVQNAAQYTNQLHEVDVSNPRQILAALANNVCLILQQKTNGILTSFVCSSSLAVLDSIYGIGFIDTVFLTKRLYDYTYNFANLRPTRENASPRKPNILNVFSCSLRFRNDGVHHDKGNMVLSSPFYSVNMEKIFCMYILDNPARLGDTITSDFKQNKHLGIHDFDMKMFKEVRQDVLSGVNSFTTPQSMMKYITQATQPGKVSVNEVVDRYARDFSYMQYLRKSGSSLGDPKTDTI